MISVAALKAMAARGATVDMIIAAIEAEQGEAEERAEKMLAEKREKDRARQSKSRASRASRVTAVTSCDIAGNEQSVAAAPDARPQAHVAIVAGAAPQQTSQPPQKENPPHPLKKNTSSFLSFLISESEERKDSVVTRAREAPGFEDRFWPRYPHKVGKIKARKAFVDALRRVDLETMLAALDRYIAKTDDRPWCNPATWLNEGRWDDNPASQSRAPPRGRGNNGGFTGVLVDRYLERTDGGTGNHDGTDGFAAIA